MELQDLDVDEEEELLGQPGIPLLGSVPDLVSGSPS